MPHHKSAKKRVRQTIRRTERNRSQNSEMKTFVKKIKSAITEKNKEEALKNLPIVQSLLDRLAKRGILKTETASRRNSRLASQVAKL